MLDTVKFFLVNLLSLGALVFARECVLAPATVIIATSFQNRSIE